ncbi:4'-phosphopantetheinyl transferase superfamily protein [Flavobacteriaceae bacterium]|nr:4'-phosphopantetheinyl transferase superfamily protein [Flavobacteriaceae bacterium]
MPIINDFFTPTSCQLAVWHIDESIDKLERFRSLSIPQSEELLQRKTDGAKKGFIAVRMALESLGISLHDLTINAKGEPQLPNAFCSLSHCKDYAIAVVGDAPLGIDVESYREQIVRIAPKFVHLNEQNFISSDKAIPQLTRLWTAKEAIYKAMCHPGLALATQIEVAPFTLSDTSGSAAVYLADKQLSFSLQFSTFNEHEFTLAQLTPNQ